MQNKVLVMVLGCVLSASALASANRLTDAEKCLHASVIHKGVVMSPLSFDVVLGWGPGGLLEWSSGYRQRLLYRCNSGRRVMLQVGSAIAWIGDKPVRMPAAPMYVKWRSPYNVRVLVPVRWVVETLGGQADYDPDTRTVTLSGPRGSVSFVPRGALQKPEKMYYQIAGKLYPRDDFLHGTIYFPLGEFEALGGEIPPDCGLRKKIKGSTCAPLKDLLEFNKGRLAMEWVDDTTTEVVMWMPQTGEIRTRQDD